jgi:hypothetical protein
LASNPGQPANGILPIGNLRIDRGKYPITCSRALAERQGGIGANFGPLLLLGASFLVDRRHNRHGIRRFDQQLVIRPAG